jgi:hypothetical protein
MKAVLRFILLTLTAAVVILGQGINDAKKLNPPECGLKFTSRTRKRFLSAKLSDQKDWGWVVLLEAAAQANPTVMVGSLINSQWVLTRADNALYVLIIVSLKNCFVTFTRIMQKQKSFTQWQCLVWVSTRRTTAQGFKNNNPPRFQSRYAYQQPSVSQA